MNDKRFPLVIFYIPSIILFIITLFGVVGVWGYVGAIGWSIFITAITKSFDLLASLNYETKKNKIMKWTSKRTATWLEEHFSDQNERVVQINKGIPIKVIPKGTFRVGLFRHYDELVLVDLRPKQIRVEFNDNDQISTQDSVKLGGTVSIKAKVKDNDEIIKRLVSNEIEEDETLKSYLKTSIKTIISEHKWIELTILNIATLSQLKNGIDEQLSGINLCFNIDDVIEINLSPIDNEFAQLLEQRQKEIESTKLKIEKLQAQEKAQEIIFEIEKKKIEKEFENRSITQAKEIELNEKLHQIEIARKNEANQLELKQKKAIAELENGIFQDRINLLKNNIEALAILNPALYEKIRLAEIDAQKEKEITIQKSQENLIKLIYDAKNARDKAIVDVISQIPIVQESIGVNIRQISAESDLAAENERLKKENEDLKSKKTDEDSNNS